METSGLAKVEAQGLMAASNLPADQNPVTVYLSRLGSPRSRRVQAIALQNVADLLTGGGVPALAVSWTSLRYQHTAAIRTRLAEQCAPATVRRTLAALRGVLKEAWRLGLMSAEDFARASDLAPVRGEALPAGRALGRGELLALFAACQGPLGARDAALMAVCYGAGLRRSEAVALDLEHFEPDTGALTVREGKGRKDRIVYVTNGALLALRAWVDVRGSESGPLFVAVTPGKAVTSRRLTDGGVHKAFEALARRAGVADFNPHDLRRTFVSDLLDAGADLAMVQKLAGHANANTTARYDRRTEATKRRTAEMLHVPYTGLS